MSENKNPIVQAFLDDVGFRIELDNSITRAVYTRCGVSDIIQRLQTLEETVKQQEKLIKGLVRMLGVPEAEPTEQSIG